MKMFQGLRRGLVFSLTVIFWVERVRAGTVWTNFPPGTSPVNNLSDAPVAPDMLGVRVVSGAVSFQGNNTYSGGTEIQGGTVRIDTATPFGSGALSLRGGLMQCNGAYTVGNAVSLDGPFSFGYSGGSSYDNPIAFSQPLVLNGNYLMTHLGNGGGSSGRPARFNAGVADGGSGYNLIVTYGTYNNAAFVLGSGSTYTGTTVVHGATLQLVGTLTTTAAVRANRGGTFQCFWDAAGADNRLGNGVPVLLSGGQMQASIYSGYSDYEATETIGTVQLDYGHSTMSIAATRAHGTMTITDLVPDGGSTVLFYRSGASQSNGSGGYGYGRIKITGQAAGFMGGWATARRSEYVSGVLQDSGYDFAWYDTGTAVLSGVLPMSLSSEPRPDQVEGSTAADHVMAVSSQTPLTADTSVNSLCVTNGGDNDLGGHSLDIVSGGLLNPAGTYAMTNGTLTSSGGALYLVKYGTTMTIHSAIAGAGLLVSTVGSQTLTADNTFSGKLHVNSGTLTLSGANAAATEATVAPGAVLSLQHPAAILRPVVLNLLYDGEEYGKCNLGTNITVLALNLDGVSQPKAEYTAATHPSYFTGTGILKVIPPPRGTVVTFR